MKKKLAIVVMRAQLATNAHFSLIEYAGTKADNVLVLIGSSNRSVSNRNPFFWPMREEMLRAGLHGELTYRTSFLPLRDTIHMDMDWKKEVQKCVRKESKRLGSLKDSDIVLVGHDKDDTTYYVNQFPEWALENAPSFGDVNATMVREKFFNGEDVSAYTRPDVVEVLEKYKHANAAFGYDWVVRNMQEVVDFQAPYIDLPYGIKFMTTDALIVCDDNVLLIQRGEGIGQNQWALPGGFVNKNEVVKTALTRELFEETRIDVPMRALRQGYKGMKRFEGATRDDRGDFTTFCGISFIERNPDGTLPRVVGSSDAKDAKWKSFAEIEQMQKYMFLDHAFIIEVMRRIYCSGDYNI